MAVIAALSLSNNSQKQNTYARDLAEATKYGNEAIDWLRTQRDELGWATLSSEVTRDQSSGIYCLNTIPATDFIDLESGNCHDGEGGSYITGTTFQREIIIDNSEASSGILKAKVIVSWRDKIDRTTSIEAELTKW
jgi:hypothetical protein